MRPLTLDRVPHDQAGHALMAVPQFRDGHPRRSDRRAIRKWRFRQRRVAWAWRLMPLSVKD